MSGVRYESLADVPPKVRGQAAGKLVKVKTAAGKKYHNQPTAVDGITFDSKKEAMRFEALKDAVLEGAITDLRLQRTFTLQEAFTAPDGERHRAITYKADFTYQVCLPLHHVPCCCGAADLAFWQEVADTCGPGTMVIEDVKSAGTRTDKYRMKKKMMADRGYRIREV